MLNLVIPKPDIPRDIAMNYKAVKVQWTEQLVATQQQKTEEIKKETEKLRAIADAERNKAVLEIKIQERLLEKEGEANIVRDTKSSQNLANTPLRACRVFRSPRIFSRCSDAKMRLSSLAS